MTEKISQMSAAGSLAGSEQLEVSQLSTSVVKTATTISALASDNSYNDSGGGFVTAGFAVNDQVRVQGFTGDVANNIFSGKITALTASKMTIGGTDGDVIADDAAGESVTITKWLTRRLPVSSVPGAGGGYLARQVVGSTASGTDLSFAVNSTSYINAGNLFLGIDLDAFLPTHFRILVINAQSSEAAQTVTLQLATAASATAVLHTGGNDLVCDNTQSNDDSGWRTFDNPSSLTGFQILALALKGSNGTVDFIFRKIEIHFKK